MGEAGRERGRQGGSRGGREGAREAGRERGRQEGSGGGREGAWEAGREQGRRAFFFLFLSLSHFLTFDCYHASSPLPSLFSLFYILPFTIFSPPSSLSPYFDSLRLDLSLFGLRPIKSKTIRQKNLKKIKFYHVGLLNILINSHKAVKRTIL
jgi:hypothetical protein